MIGTIFMAIVFTPIILLMGAFVFEKPRDFRVPALTLLSIVVLTAIFIGIFAVFGLVLGALVP